MKKNKLLVSSTILVLPLLMANSPAPQAFPNKYDDATISYVKTGEINNEFIYDITITNNGNGYIDLNDSYFSYLQLDEKTIINNPQKNGLTFYELVFQNILITS